MTEAGLEHDITVARHEHVVPGREIRMQDMRGYRFCEVGLVTGTSPDTAVANIWNTTGACDPTPERLDALDADAIARENAAQCAWLDPVRRWMSGRSMSGEAGVDRTFGGITGTWMAVAGAATITRATVQSSYCPGYGYRNNTFTFNNGSEVCLPDAPDGGVFVMQSFTRHWDPALSKDNLSHLGRSLDLPGGWGFRVERLDEDMEVSSNPETSDTSCRTTCTTSTAARMRAGHSATYAENTSAGSH